jgi:hypothetical protein
VGADLALKLVDELKRMYDTYLESAIPPGDVPLRGDEAESIRAFKEALGLSDEDAAPVHIDVGRRIMRSRFEASTRSGSSESFRALQKLIYVSELVFGARKVCACYFRRLLAGMMLCTPALMINSPPPTQAAFLLPWRRVFNLSDSQLYIARRENAKALFRGFIDSRGGKLQANRAALAELKAFQEKVRLEDDIAAEGIKEAARAQLEAALDRGVECLKRRTRVRDYGDAVRALKEALAYSRALASLAGDPALPPGLGPVSVYGGRLESQGRELRELFRYELFLLWGVLSVHLAGMSRAQAQGKQTLQGVPGGGHPHGRRLQRGAGGRRGRAAAHAGPGRARGGGAARRGGVARVPARAARGLPERAPGRGAQQGRGAGRPLRLARL